MKAIIIGLFMAMLATPAFADYVGPNREQQQDSPYMLNPWNDVVRAYDDQGHKDDSFVNRAGVKWYVWEANQSHDTLIWSKQAHIGYTCKADSRPNTWEGCTRYSLYTGQPVPGFMSVRIDRGMVIAWRGRSDCDCPCHHHHHHKSHKACVTMLKLE